MSGFSLEFPDYVAFGAYFVVLCFIGWWVGRKEKSDSSDYFLAGRSLPWYVVGSSFIASNISTEHFIGMIGAAYLYGICVAWWEWGNVFSFTLLIWFFIPFLLNAKVFTTPEFLEKRYNSLLRQSFAIVTVISNVVAFLAAVLYGGGLALHKLFGWNLWLAIIALGVVAGSWAIYGGLKSVAWTDFFTVIIMFVGGIAVTILGLYMLSGDESSLVQGCRVMIERNRADTGIWAGAVARHAQRIVHADNYNRMALIQPTTHVFAPWLGLLFGVFSISLWYNVINQFMIQRVLAAKDMYHARMGLVLAGYMKLLLPVIVVVPGLILFARFPEIMDQPWDRVAAEADKGYVTMLQMLVPVGLRGLFLAALFGAIQSTVNSVLNSTATIFTLDIYQKWIRRDAGQKHLVRTGIWSSVAILLFSILLAGYIDRFSGGLFGYVQTLYAFFAPPFAAVFLLGILFRRINGQGASAAVIAGFVFGILLKVYVQMDGHPLWLEPFMTQAFVNWTFCVVVCTVVSLLTEPPQPEQVTDDLALNWKKLNIFSDLGARWYQHVLLWWGLFVLIVLGLAVALSGAFL